MRSEIECQPFERFLFAEHFLTIEEIKAWQLECSLRSKENQKGEVYEKFINWVRKPNEIAAFTLYAFADFDIPKKFDCIFNCENPRNYLIVDYELTQCIFEGWFPVNNVSHGHKHLCVFAFVKKVPDLLYSILKGQSRLLTSSNNKLSLGFCNSIDLPSITDRWFEVENLKGKYGDD